MLSSDIKSLDTRIYNITNKIFFPINSAKLNKENNKAIIIIQVITFVEANIKIVAAITTPIKKQNISNKDITNFMI